jgi:hypothetical protein
LGGKEGIAAAFWGGRAFFVVQVAPSFPGQDRRVEVEVGSVQLPCFDAA